MQKFVNSVPTHSSRDVINFKQFWLNFLQTASQGPAFHDMRIKSNKDNICPRLKKLLSQKLKFLRIINFWKGVFYSMWVFLDS